MRIFLEPGERQLLKVSPALVVRQVWGVGLEARGLEMLAEGVERPTAAKRPVHKHDWRCDR